MSSEKELNSGSRKRVLLSEQALLGQLFQKSSKGTAMLPSRRLKKSPPSLDVALKTFLSLATTCAPMVRNLAGEPTLRIATSSTLGRYSKRSTKPTKAVTATPAEKGWIVQLHRDVAKDVTDYGLSNTDFTPTLAELVASLEHDPKKFPKKKGKLKDARAADLKYRAVTFRAVFVLNEAARVVRVLSLDPHDAAYEKATRRV
jgi:hypothetical protein